MIPVFVSPQNTCSFISTPFMFSNVLWHYTRLSTLSQRICSTFNKGCVSQQGHKALNESAYTRILLHRKYHVEAACFVSWSFVNSTGSKQRTAEHLETMKRRSHDITLFLEINVSKYISLYNYVNNSNYYYYYYYWQYHQFYLLF